MPRHRWRSATATTPRRPQPLPCRSRLDQASGAGDPQRGLLRTGAGAVRTGFSAHSGVLRILDHREGQGGSRGVDPRTRQGHRGSDRRNTGVPCCTTSALPSLVAFRCRRRLDVSYLGIVDTDLDKNTEDAVQLFGQSGISTVFINLEGFPEDWKENPDSFVKFVRDHHSPSFLEYGEYRALYSAFGPHGWMPMLAFDFCFRDAPIAVAAELGLSKPRNHRG